jgi:hypothetical protein
MLLNVAEKVCLNCGPLPLSAFDPNATSADGFNCFCRPCVAAMTERAHITPKRPPKIKTPPPPPVATPKPKPAKRPGPVIPGTFVCSKCGHVGPIEDFRRDNSYTSGYRSECKECHNKGRRNEPKAQPPAALLSPHRPASAPVGKMLDWLWLKGHAPNDSTLAKLGLVRCADTAIRVVKRPVGTFVIVRTGGQYVDIRRIEKAA